jgi:hypothetical protein
VVVVTLLTGVPANVVETICSACDRSRWLWDPNARLAVLDIKLDAATAAGDRLAALLARLSERERDRTARRTRSGLAERGAEGGSVGRPAVADRPDLRDRIGAMPPAGMRWQAIPDRLNDEGVATLRGGVGWRPSSVQATLGNRRPGPRSVGEVGGSIPGLAGKEVTAKYGGQTR